MDSFEEERLYWKRLYENEEIDEATYIRNIDVINKRNDFSKSSNFGYPNGIFSNTKNNFNPMTKLSAMIFGMVIALCFIFIYRVAYVNKEYVAVNSLGELSAPEQYSASGSATKIIDNTEVDIEYVASYKICGRVVKTYSYPQIGVDNKLSPVDVGLTWGSLARDENNSKVIWGNSGNRFLTWTIYDTDWYSSYGATNFQKNTSNSHLIPEDDEIKKKVNAIKEGEYIMITGYLVNVEYELENGRKYNWNTSTTRLDSGDGACELIYVTNVDWLTEVEN